MLLSGLLLPLLPGRAGSPQARRSDANGMARFPRAAARLYLASGQPQPLGLAASPDAPSQTAVHAAAARLRQLAGDAGAGQRQQALAAFVLGKGEAERGETAAAARDLAAAARWAPARDAATAALVGLWAQQQDPQPTLEAAQEYALPHDDPFIARIAKPAARAAVQLQRWSDALPWTERYPRDPEMLWLQAQAEAGLGQTRKAALAERALVYGFPASSFAQTAGLAWQRQVRALPKLAAGWKLTAQQAAAWARVGKPQEAAETWARAAQMAPRRQRPELEAQEVRSWLHAGHLITTRTRLRNLLHGPQRAQALELEVELARHRGLPDALEAPLASLAQEFPHSRWYARALDEAGNQAVLAFDDAAAQARFDRLSQAFPHSDLAAKANWRASWIAFRQQQSGTPARLQHYLRAYPHGPAAVDAIYWRGIWAEQHHDAKLAQQCFLVAARHFPGTYFGQQAALRLPNPRANADPPAPRWLQPYQKARASPEAPTAPSRFQADLQRAEWMQAAGLLEPAAAILGHVLHQVSAPQSLAVARLLGAVASERGAWNQGLEAMVRAVPHYEELQPGQLPAEDWKLLFPAPYRGDIAAAVQHFGLNPYLMLGLIRQESGFNPGAVSSALARGLMQLELGTARGRMQMLPAQWRRLKGPGRLSATDLLQPGLNLALGAAELQRLLTQFKQPAFALAGYNAGSKRVQQWQSQFPGLSLNAFIESVPFSQTRGYIQAVLRNAAQYRTIYDVHTGT